MLCSVVKLNLWLVSKNNERILRGDFMKKAIHYINQFFTESAEDKADFKPELEKEKSVRVLP